MAKVEDQHLDTLWMLLDAEQQHLQDLIDMEMTEEVQQKIDSSIEAIEFLALHIEKKKNQ